MEENRHEINEIVEKAFRMALNKEHEYVTLEHLTLVILEHKEIKEFLMTIGVENAPIIEDISNFLNSIGDLVVPGLTKPRKT